MLGSRSQVSELQRRRLIAAMVQVVAERGVTNVSVANVVTYAGVSRRTFYEIFADGDACFLAAFEYCLERAAAPVLGAYERERRWQDAIRAGLVALLGFIEEEPAMGRLLLVDCPLAGEHALARRACVLEALTAAVHLGAEEATSAAAWPAVIAEGVVAAVLSVIHTRLLREREPALRELVGPLMSMVVLPYLGVAAARRELERPPLPLPPRAARPSLGSERPPRRGPLEKLGTRLTYRTVLVLSAIANSPGASNRAVGNAAGIVDQGQVSKLLARLLRLGLIENTGDAAKGSANAWTLTTRGAEVQQPLVGSTSYGSPGPG
jgi:AcrR family transcriptional regulator